MHHRCFMFETLLSRVKLPIARDPETDQYYLLINKTRKGRIAINFCPWCATPISADQAGNFHEPEKNEVQALKRRLSGAKTIADVTALLGSPDRSFDLGPSSRASSTKRHSLEHKHVIKQVDYENVARSFELSVQEIETGGIRYLYCPKPLRKTSK